MAARLIYIMLSFCRQLAVTVLLIAVVLAPLTSDAHSLDSGMTEDTCICQLLQDDWADCGHENNDNHDELPCDSSGDCCDEDCCHDSGEPPFMVSMIVAALIQQRSYVYSSLIPPEVYLAIFVPPES